MRSDALGYREFHAATHRVNALGADAHAIAVLPRELLRLCAATSSCARAAPPLIAAWDRNNGVILLAIHAARARRFLQRVDRQQPLHKHLEQLHKAAVLLHGNNQAVVFFAEMLLHELRRLPVHQLALGAIRAALRFGSFRGYLLELYMRIHNNFRPAWNVWRRRRAFLRMLQRPLQRAM